MPDPIEATDDEAQLVRRARWGQEAAFAELYRRHARAIHALALRLTGNPSTAEDITQECFLKMLQFLGDLRDGTPLRPWLKRVAANAAIDRIRRDGRLVAAEDDDAHPANGPDPLLHAESLGLLRRLSPIERTVVWLHAMEGWSHPELGRRFGRSESWSKSIVSRSLSRLRLELDEPHTHDDP
ncbi:RNA polymerase sigma factor [Luteimonas sp. 22616]|uniref:RNA polymerase sigma factor n=1 Tax=Luteimonas sp. 22616 TaxID=3453951 RepID=UPI003F872D8D